MTTSRWTLLALLLLTAPYLPWLIDYWQMPASYVMGSPIALACAALAYRRESKGRRQDGAPSTALGISLLSVSLLVYLAASIIFARRSIAGAALAAVVASLFYLRGGWTRLWQFRFTASFLFLAAPVPGLVVNLLNRYLIDFATKASSSVLGLFYSGVEHQGSLIELPRNGALEVVPDCSGLEGIVLFFVLGVLLVFLHPRLGIAWKLALPALGIGFAIAGNLLRIISTGVLQIRDAELAANDTVHQVIGVASLGVMMIALFLLPRLLRGAGPGPRNGEVRPV